VDKKTNYLIKESASLSSKLQPFTKEVELKLRAGVYNNKKIFEELRNCGYKGSYGLLNNYVQTKRKEEISNKINYYQKVETGPGEQAQVDWAHFGKVSVEGRDRNLYAFIYILSYSRAMYAEFVTTQKQQIFQDCHIHAFEKLGVPKVIRYDNVKTVVISRHRLGNGKEKINFNFDFSNFAQHYHFEPEVCPPYYPRSKGKVEAGVKYLRHNFMSGEIFEKTFDSMDELNSKLIQWLEITANKRIHATTKRRPCELWLKEKEHLFEIDHHPRFKNKSKQSRWSSQNSMVTYDKSFYWVPREFARKKINIEEEMDNGISKLLFYFKGDKIIEHIKAEKSGSWILPKDYKLKGMGKKREIEQRLEANPVYKTKVEVRDMSYYNKFL
jgi:transposase